MDRSGFLIVSIGGLELSPTERNLLQHPAIAGVILYKRNYSDRSQLVELIEALRSIKAGFVVSVDQECARVQNLGKDFTRLPMPREIGHYYDRDTEAALKLAYAYGVIIGAEMREVNIDLSYAPVLDIAHFGGVIGERAFHENPAVVVVLAREMISGLHNSSLAACGKHFPGHGSVAGDTHTDTIRDPRMMSEIEAHDLYPFSTLIQGAYLDSIMLSHIIYEAVSDMPASLSEYWIKTVLREQLGFDGFVCSDDLDMVGSGNTNSGTLKRALDAGCDVLLICRRRAPQLQQLVSEFSSSEIEKYSDSAAKHLNVIDTYIHNRIPRETKHYKAAVAKVEQFNDHIDTKNRRWYRRLHRRLHRHLHR